MAPADALLPCKMGTNALLPSMPRIPLPSVPGAQPADGLPTVPGRIDAASLLDGLRGGDAPPGGEGGRRLIDGCREMGEEAAVACHGCRVGVLGAKLF